MSRMTNAQGPMHKQTAPTGGGLTEAPLPSPKTQKDSRVTDKGPNKVGAKG